MNYTIWVLQKLHVGDLEDGFLSLQFKTATQQQRTSRQSMISSVVFCDAIIEEVAEAI